jgi:uncharacterized membrane protein SpoIIM required for sporulation
MSYPRFVRQRKPAWDEFDGLLARGRREPLSHRALETLAFLYRRILNDHAVVTHRFPRTAAAERLQHLALEGTHMLRLESGAHVVGPRGFFTRVFPRAFRRFLPHIGVAVLLFSTALLLGFSMTALRPRIGLALLGPQAEAGLKEGRLWTESLVTTIPPAFSSSAIATNNMSVALTGWAGGVLAGLGALHVALLNGFMLGAVLATTWHYSMAGALLEFVSAHGPLEITLILVCAGAGLGMGEALVSAGDRPRREVVGDAARSAVAVLIGCLPWFLLLGVVEGFLSPAPELPGILKLAVGLGLETLFLSIAWNPFLPEAE